MDNTRCQNNPNDVSKNSYQDISDIIYEDDVSNNMLEISKFSQVDVANKIVHRENIGQKNAENIIRKRKYSDVSDSSDANSSLEDTLDIQATIDEAKEFSKKSRSLLMQSDLQDSTSEGRRDNFRGVADEFDEHNLFR